MSQGLPPPRLRRLPHTVVPLHHETTDSYMSRLAAANRLTPRELHEYISDPDRIHPDPLPLLDALAGLSGYPAELLVRALPELRSPGHARSPVPTGQWHLDRGWVIQAACRLCLASKNVTEPARCWVPITTKLCSRHRRWTDTHGDQLDLRHLPEVPRAQHQHFRLVHRHGLTRVSLAFEEASNVCWGWWNSRKCRAARDHRMAVLSGPNWNVVNRDDLRIVVSTYPDIVALTSVFVSPTLRSLPFTGRPADLRRFIDEIRTRIAPGYRYEDANSTDPLRRWMEAERHYRTADDHPFPIPPVPVSREGADPNRSTNDLRCLTCGTRLGPQARPNAAFCSSACRARRWRLHQAEPSKRKVKCRICKSTWTEGLEHRKGAIYCSARCKTEAWRRRKLGY
ncbi:TniQ family protein [Streptomyces sp. NPDC088551]|uniref:TniQ family protein n=1 Tax=Streptomyces sp. NPDC088551 TaxID=3365863 RepID=UPI00381C730B